MQFLGILIKLFLTTCRLIWEALEFDGKTYKLYQPQTIILTYVRHINLETPQLIDNKVFNVKLEK